MTTNLTRTDEDLRQGFLNLKTPRELAQLLEVSYSNLTFHAYRNKGPAYATFSIPKKSGGLRTISAPITPLKIIQRKLNQVLTAVYEPKPPTHGFVRERNILSNASPHVGRKWVFNVDIEDFFGSIHFGRVRGMFMEKPYSLPNDVATVIAQLACHDGRLPQGSPCSPVISNMVCRRLDAELRRLAEDHHCTMTRYGDDITFSTNARRFPTALAECASTTGSGEATPGPALLRCLVEQNTFKPNLAKVRLCAPNVRQEVTGLPVNRRLNVPRKYVRQLRAMLHAWERFGYDAAEQEYHAKYAKPRRQGAKPPSFTKVIRGKLAFLALVRGETDTVYVRLATKYAKLEPAFTAPERPLTAHAGLNDVAQCVWVLDSEADGNQGTGFLVDGVGMVTCDHVVGSAVVAYRPDAVSQRYPLTVRFREAAMDLAVLDVSGLPADAPAVRLPKDDLVSLLDEVFAFGFPNYNFGDSVFVTQGRVVGRRTRSTVRRLVLNSEIAKGMSGGPVALADGTVVAVAATGTNSIAEARTTEDHTAIPVEAVRALCRANGLLLDAVKPAAPPQGARAVEKAEP